MQYYVLGDEDTVLGFRLVGVEGRIVKNQTEAEYAFYQLINDERRIGILIITERIAELIRLQVDRFLFREKFPLIIEIPDRLGPLVDKPDLRTLVNQAIGIKL